METHNRNDRHVGEWVGEKRKRGVGMICVLATESGNEDGNAESE